MDCSSALPPGQCAAFLAALAGDGPISHKTALVVAHPDDEAIGAGGQIHRFDKLIIVVASDGAPRDGRDVARLGFPSAQAYAQTRRAELVEAIRAGGACEAMLVQLNLRDGDLIFSLDRLIPALTAAFARRAVEIVLTHAYEGGHPDHDALALAVRLAARRLAPMPAVFEMPYYRAGAEGWALQDFADDDPTPIRIELTGHAWERKCAMIDAHRSQADLLRGFRRPFESFRPAPEHDFCRLPNGGRLLYAQVAPSLRPETWLAHARAALSAEGRA